MAETVRLTFDIVQRVRYPPELLPFSAVFTVPAQKYVSPAILDIKKLNVKKIIERMVVLAYVSQPRNTSIDLEYKVDNITRELDTEAMKNYPELEELFLPATDKLYLNYKNTSGVDVTNYYSVLGLWVLAPTTVEKMLYKYYDVISSEMSEEDKLARMELIPVEERRLAAKYGIIKLLEKGTYPLRPSPDPLRDLGFKLEREYQVIREEVDTFTGAIEAGQESLVFDIKPNERKGEFVVLTGISAQPPADPAYGTQIVVERDEEGEYFRLDCYPMSLDWYLPMWIPATVRLRVSVWTDTAISSWSCRIRYKICRLNNILRARWFYDDFVAKHPELEEFAERVRLGIW